MSEKKLRVTCSCGQTLAFKPEQVGGRFRCPACKEPLDLIADEEPEEEAPPPPRRGAAPRAPGASVKRPGSGFTARGPAGAPSPRPPAGSALSRRGGRPPAEEAADEETADEAPRRSAPGQRGRGGPSAANVPVAVPVSPEQARKKKMMLIGAGGGALVLVIVIAGFFALKGPGKPENAGKASEGAEVWKPISADFTRAEKQDEASAREAAFKKVLEQVEGTRKLHDYGWPDFFKGRALARLGKYDEAKASLEAAIGKLDKSAQVYAKIERGLIASRQHLERLLRTRRFRAAGVSLAPDAEADAAAKAALPDLKLAESAGAKKTDFFSDSLFALARAEAERIEGRPGSSAARERYGSVSSGDAACGYATLATGGLLFEVDKYEEGVKTMESAMDADHNSPLSRLSAAWGLRRRAQVDPENADAKNWLVKAVDLADKAAGDGHPAAFAAAAALRLDLAAIKLGHGEDAKAELDEADAKATAALAKDPGDPAATEVQAVVTFRKAELEERAGKDPRPLLKSAISRLDALAGDGKDFPAVLSRARIELKLARAEGAKEGGDPATWFDRAAKDFDAVRGNDGPNGGTIEPKVGAAIAKVEKAIVDSRKGTDVTEIFKRVISDMSSLSAKSQPEVLEAKGLAEWALADAYQHQGKTDEATKAIGDATTDLSELFDAKPSLRVGEILVDAFLAEGAALIKAGQNPRQAFQNASERVDACLKLAPGNTALQLKRGKALSSSAEVVYEQQGDPTVQLATAIKDFTAILATAPDNLEALYERARALTLLSREEFVKGEDSRPDLTSAIRDYSELVLKDSKSVPAALGLAEAILFMGQTDFFRHNDATETYARALGKMDAAVKMDDKNARAWNGLGSCYLCAAEMSRRDHKEYTLFLEQAEAAYKKALELGYARSQANLGIVWAYQGKYDEAEKAWDEAIGKCPDRKDPIAGMKGWLKKWKDRLGSPAIGSPDAH